MVNLNIIDPKIAQKLFNWGIAMKFKEVIKNPFVLVGYSAAGKWDGEKWFIRFRNYGRWQTNSSIAI